MCGSGRRRQRRLPGPGESLERDVGSMDHSITAGAGAVHDQGRGVEYADVFGRWLLAAVHCARFNADGRQCECEPEQCVCGRRPDGELAEYQPELVRVPAL